MDEFQKVISQIDTFFKSSLGSVVLFILVAFIGLVVIKIVMYILSKIKPKKAFNSTIKHFLLSIVKLILYVVYVLTLLSIMGVPITTFVAILTAMSLAITLAVQNSLSNLTNGMVIIANQNFHEGDLIEIDGFLGKVEKIGVMNTVIKTATNERITIPHNTTINSIMTTYPANSTRRIDITVSVAYNSDVEKVKSIMTKIVKDHPSVLQDKEIQARLSNFGTSSIDFILKCWSDSENYWDCKFDILESIFEEFKVQNIEIPYQKIDININNPDKNN